MCWIYDRGFSHEFISATFPTSLSQSDPACLFTTTDEKVDGQDVVRPILFTTTDGKDGGQDAVGHGRLLIMDEDSQYAS